MSGTRRHDARFYALSGPHTVETVAKRVGARLVQQRMADRRLDGVAPIDHAGSTELAFAAGRGASARLTATPAGACLVAEGSTFPDDLNTALLAVDDPKRAFIAAASLFVSERTPARLAHPTAFVDDDAWLGADVAVGANAVIEGGARIGDRTVVGPGAVIGEGCVLGAECVVGPNAVLTHAVLGDRVRIAAGAVIGQPGFGFSSGLDGHVRTPQIGRVLIEDDVEIGACTTVDRGALDDTVIERGAKIDNLVQVGHNVRVGAHAVLVAQVGLSGSADIGSFAVLGGQAGVSDHVKVGDGAQVGARSGVMREVDAGAKVLGAPAKPAYAFFREVAALQRLAARGKANDRKPKDREA